MTQNIKLIFVSVFFTLVSLTLSAQDIYFGVQTGYGFATSAGQANLVSSDVSGQGEVYEILEGGYGEGIYTGIFVGYSFTKNLGVELGSNYLFGRHLTTETIYDNFNWSYSKTTVSSSIQMLQLSPQLVFRANHTKLTPFVKVGLTFGLGTTLTQNTSEYNVTDPGYYEIESTKKSTGNIPIGFSSTLGANYKVDKKVNLFATLQLLTMSYSPNKTTITTYVLNENNALDDLTIYQREMIYLDKIENDNVPINDDEPSEALRISLPLSNVTFNIGLQIDLGTIKQ